MNLDFSFIFKGFDKNETLLMLAIGTATLCTMITLFAICIDFVKYHNPKVNKKKVNSLVETGSMFLYFLLYVFLMKFKIGYITIDSKIIENIIIIMGMILLIIGCYINVKGRFILKHNWANQVTIYHNHTFINTSVYNWIRHPLYASIIWMLLGGSLIYHSYFAFLSVILMFIPMMYYRANQEERLLSSEFSEYVTYKQKTGMFFPKRIYYGKI